MPPADRTLAVEFESLRAKYAASVPLVATAKSVGDIVDLVVRYELTKAPHLRYHSVMVSVLEADPELKAAYCA